MHCQTLVLGAGIVGVSSALHLQARSRQVVLLDRQPPGNGTSHGNAGLIERASVIPYAFPREVTKLVRYGLNQQSDVRYSLRHLPKAGPWLLQYWRHSSPKGLAAATRAMLPLIERCVSEHLALARPANMLQLIADGGWLEAFNDQEAFDFAQRAAADLRDYQLNYRVLDRTALLALEPGLHQDVVGGLHWLDPKTVSDPGGLTRGYAELFKQRGGQFVIGDALSLTQIEGGWQVQSELGPITAQEMVVALGPQASGIFEPLGYRIPLAIKRGYHMHYAALPGTRLQHPILDPVGGYVLAPMVGGIRLTTGIEFADRDDPINEIQLRRCEALARRFYPLGERLDAEPWLGRRPCLPDMCPVIGPAPRHPGLWFNFGHAHHGLTLGPVSGHLLAQMVTGETPFTDPTPYRAERFN
ncbi:MULTISPECIES: FAD-binding oxidoreductase [unclassified Pseudomonas]|uniref:NAD(P)/FAD-dependent oxidoreductase n=1 Tax=unclassified Pseudomonas TaxID=196821 RepID=UPI0008766806|nr:MULTISPECIES: FAD-binding oxidoreductase [unclassified Pseudomonas]SCZ75151.1 D-amino-acid dehydrogenase [Pseudomonas sp. NFPP17]SDA86898.1 D-amino-acid dehydrogenase [Pseudomonas sp. NFPP15]SEL90186.1 D-amino-acid dehydrogenase [Pseudomonas sp. NFPP18]SFA67611.1 D-amino-acid dehydrogenase [Pseudomonas sp. NFPP13]SFU09843.1 D-amino-acid dehydrogenase [Pseudomonas sp. NFPP25]